MDKDNDGNVDEEDHDDDTDHVDEQQNFYSVVRARCYLPRVTGRPSKTRAPTPTHCTAP